MNGRVACALALLVALAGCRAADPRYYPPTQDDQRADLIVLDNHWHTAVIFRSSDLPDSFRAQLGPIAQANYLMIGWGDEGFFRAERVTAGLALQALFASRGSVVLVVGLAEKPELSFDAAVDIYRIPTSEKSLQKAIEMALTAFRRDGKTVIDAGPGIDGGRFFAGTGRYAFYHTCNNWTADVLTAGGMPISAAFAQTAGNLAFQVRQIPGVRRNGAEIPKPRQPDFATLQLTRGRRP